jgi:hypothetical protein
MVPVISAALLLLLAGCATPKIDWSARVGNYTYDQAVMNYGPPDQMTKLSDSSTVAEWLMRHGEVVVASEPYFWGPGYYYYPPPPMYYQSYVPARFLRLVFAPDGKLKAWKEFER